MSRAESPIHLLLTDVVMPGVDRGRLAVLLKKARPALAALYMSGYTENSIIRRGAQEEWGLEFIAKTFGPDELAARVREVLARAAIAAESRLQV